MGILKKIATAIRGGAREAGEAIVDANAIRILEQEIKDSENHLSKAKHNLTEVMAQRMQVARKISTFQGEIREHEGYAEQALSKGDETLALEVAEKIAELEQQLNEQEEVHATYRDHVKKLKAQIHAAEKQVKEFKRQFSMVKTTESVQKATSAISDNFSSSNSTILGAKSTLERIKAKQTMREDKITAANELAIDDSSDLKSKLQSAGIGAQTASANSVLDRIKAKKTGSKQAK
ncbi:MAG: PspA/IM30 family protein [Thiohalomonadales bacterium]